MSLDDLLSLCNSVNTWSDFLLTHKFPDEAVFVTVFHDGITDEFLFGRVEPAGAFLHVSGLIHLYVLPDACSLKLFTRPLLPEEKKLIGFLQKPHSPGKDPYTPSL